MRSSKRDSLQYAILRTICYADVFDFALSVEELCTNTISPVPITKSAIERVLAQTSGTIQRRGYVCLKDRSSAIARRFNTRALVGEKMRQAQEIVQTIGWIPTISAMFVTGSLAAGNVRKKEDIDVMIVTKPGWLWTTRAAVVLIATLAGKYRRKSMTRTSDTWCFNLWLDEHALAVPPSARNLYTAHEVVQAKPIMDRAHISERFLAANTWVKRHLANAMVGVAIPLKAAGKHSMYPIERVFYTMQTAYMASAKTVEKVGEGFAFFHPRNTAALVLKAYRKRLRAVAKVR